MTGTVPILSIVFMGISGILSFIIPIGLLLYFRKKGAEILPFFIGCAVFFIFALVLEQIFHQIVLLSPIGNSIQNNILIYAVYGGLAAGLFEETGRLLAFKTIMKRYRENDVNSLMYGAGHGGFEAIAILGVTMINNIVISIMINSGASVQLLTNMPAEAAETLRMQLDSLTTAASWLFLIGIIERILAMISHIVFSAIVWFAVKNNKIVLFLLAILMHALLDAVTVLVARSGINGAEYLAEAVVAILVAVFVFVARIIWKKETKKLE